MYFSTKNILKSNRNYPPKHAKKKRARVRYLNITSLLFIIIEIYNLISASAISCDKFMCNLIGERVGF